MPVKTSDNCKTQNIVLLYYNTYIYNHHSRVLASLCEPTNPDWSSERGSNPHIIVSNSRQGIRVRCPWDYSTCSHVECAFSFRFRKENRVPIVDTTQFPAASSRNVSVRSPERGLEISRNQFVRGFQGGLSFLLFLFFFFLFFFYLRLA